MSVKTENACQTNKSDERCTCMDQGPNLACWAPLNTTCKNVDILIAINPQAIVKDKMFKIRPPAGPHMLSQQLLVRHRNSYEISMFLDFLKHSPFSQSYLDNTLDKELDAPTLPRGRLPVWIVRGPKVSDIRMLERIKQDHILGQESVTLIHKNEDPAGNPELSPISAEVKSWCDDNGWRRVSVVEAIGGEDECVVVFDVEDLGLLLECCSRGRNGLIIMTTQG